MPFRSWKMGIEEVALRPKASGSVSTTDGREEEDVEPGDWLSQYERDRDERREEASGRHQALRPADRRRAATPATSVSATAAPRKSRCASLTSRERSARTSAVNRAPLFDQRQRHADGPLPPSFVELPQEGALEERLQPSRAAGEAPSAGGSSSGRSGSVGLAEITRVHLSQSRRRDEPLLSALRVVSTLVEELLRAPAPPLEDVAAHPFLLVPQSRRER